jgi:hypothetical protein
VLMRIIRLKMGNIVATLCSMGQDSGIRLRGLHLYKFKYLNEFFFFKKDEIVCYIATKYTLVNIINGLSMLHTCYIVAFVAHTYDFPI